MYISCRLIYTQRQIIKNIYVNKIVCVCVFNRDINMNFVVVIYKQVTEMWIKY